MNRLIIIGNGFDLAHGLKTSYRDFICWYWEDRLQSLTNNYDCSSEDPLCKLILEQRKKYEIKKTDSNGVITVNGPLIWYNFIQINKGVLNLSGDKLYGFLKKQDFIQVIQTPFFERINQDIENKGWVDIENDYYRFLKDCALHPKDHLCTIERLQEQMNYLREKLAEYLQTQDKAQKKDNIHDIIYSSQADEHDFPVSCAEQSVNCVSRMLTQDDYIYLLSFNYTLTAHLYCNKENSVRDIYIHGTLNEPDKMIFGYGDELDKDFKEIEELNDNAYLTNVKSVKYLESSTYRNLLEFVDSQSFQVFIMGHSCGNSDRTLLNYIFEHKNCVSIKPYYFIDKEGNDNYMDIAMNIYRNFTNKNLYRSKVVNKEYCEPFSGVRKLQDEDL